jgi:hypothetical protein
MDDRQKNIQDMFISTTEFDDVNAADYADLEEAAAQFAIVRDVIEKLDLYTADQTSGARSQAVEVKSVIRLAMRRKMTRIAKTARALNFSDPGFRRLFRVPDDDNDQLLIATAREFVEQATIHIADFKRLGIGQALITALAADIAALEAAIGAKAAAQTEGVGATAGVDFEIERGMKAEIILDAIMDNVYDDNPVKKAEWQSARHVRRINSAPAAENNQPSA